MFRHTVRSMTSVVYSVKYNVSDGMVKTVIHVEDWNQTKCFQKTATLNTSLMSNPHYRVSGSNHHLCLIRQFMMFMAQNTDHVWDCMNKNVPNNHIRNWANNVDLHTLLLTWTCLELAERVQIVFAHPRFLDFKVS